MLVTEQADFSGGMWRGRRAPENAFFDGVNVLLNDEGEPFKRGGTSYLTTSDAAATLVGVAETNLDEPGEVTFAWTSAGVYRVSGASLTVVPSAVPRRFARGVAVGDDWFVPGAAAGEYIMVASTGTTTFTADPFAPDLPLTSVSAVAAVGSPPRLVLTGGIYAAFSEPGSAGFVTGNYHQLPNRALITGAEGLGDTLLLFTSVGVFSVSNMSLDPLDDFGNEQHQVAHVNKDLVLWGDPGIAAWRGALLVPGLDDVFLFTPDGQARPVTGDADDAKIRPLYRAYVAAGYQPGTAAVFRGHYLLPVVNGTTLVDVLVCRLDRGFAWSRLSGAAACVAYAARFGSGTPALFGVQGLRIHDLSGCFAPSDANRLDAGGVAPAFSLTTRDFDTGPGIRGGLLRHARLEYDLVAPSAVASITVAAATGAEGSAFTAHASTAPEADGGSKTWMLNRFGERVRLRFESSDATADLRLRRLEVHTEPVQRP